MRTVDSFRRSDFPWNRFSLPNKYRWSAKRFPLNFARMRGAGFSALRRTWEAVATPLSFQHRGSDGSARPSLAQWKLAEALKSRLPPFLQASALAALAMLGLLAGVARAQTNAEAPNADALLERVILSLPRDPLQLSGELIVRKRRGVVVRRLQFEMALNWGAEPSEARYNLRDALGKDLEQLIVKRPSGRAPEFVYSRGSPLTHAPLADPYGSLQQSDVSWMDLALSFLWWRGGKISGTEKVLTRECYMVDVPAPAGSSAAPGAYASVRLWIDREMNMLLQAEGRDARNEPIRKLWVRSFKRFDDRWMIKDMEIQQTVGDHRTKLRIEDAQGAAAAKEEPEQLGAPIPQEQ